MKSPYPFETVQDADSARWVTEGLGAFGDLKVTSVVPRCFDGYARICHPAKRTELRNGRIESRLIRWSEVAVENGRSAHRRMAWRRVCGVPPLDEGVAKRMVETGRVVYEDPAEGSCPVEVGIRLLQVLKRHTPCPGDCWFGLWDGFGWWSDMTAAIKSRHRTWLLFRGPLAGVTLPLHDSWPHQSSNLIWPPGRSWFVATDVDMNSTYVGGSAELIQELAGESSLEAYRVCPEDDITVGADTVNPGGIGVDTVCVLDEATVERYWPSPFPDVGH